MININGNVYDINTLISDLKNSSVKFSFFQGRRYQLREDLNPSLSEIVKAIHQALPELISERKFEQLNHLIEALKEADKRGYEKRDPRDEFIENKDIVTRTMTQINQWLSSSRMEIINMDHAIKAAKKNLASEFEEAISKKIQENFTPISDYKDSPFADTDLIVIKEDDVGFIPPNGIKVSELTLINEIYKNIVNNQSKIRIKSSDPGFNSKILLSLKTLMTRAYCMG